jgi:hypothetical protein
VSSPVVWAKRLLVLPTIKQTSEAVDAGRIKARLACAERSRSIAPYPPIGAAKLRFGTPPSVHRTNQADTLRLIRPTCLHTLQSFAVIYRHHFDEFGQVFLPVFQNRSGTFAVGVAVVFFDQVL